MAMELIAQHTFLTQFSLARETPRCTRCVHMSRIFIYIKLQCLVWLRRCFFFFALAWSSLVLLVYLLWVKCGEREERWLPHSHIMARRSRCGSTYGVCVQACNFAYCFHYCDMCHKNVKVVCERHPRPYIHKLRSFTR